MKRRASNGGSGSTSAEPVGRIQGSDQEEVGVVSEGDAFSVLEALIGTIEAPVDWSAEHDHYLYGAPKRASGAA